MYDFDGVGDYFFLGNNRQDDMDLPDIDDIALLSQSVDDIFSITKNSKLSTLSIALSDMVVTDAETNPEKFTEFDSLNPVLYSGNPDAKVMVVARDLGYNELKKKQVLIGCSGQIFRKSCMAAGVDPEKDLYMTNLVPFRPINNKAFSDDVVSSMIWVLESQIAIVKPKLIIALGVESTAALLSMLVGKRTKQVVMHTMHRKAVESKNPGGPKILPLYHPSYFAHKTHNCLATKYYIEVMDVVKKKIIGDDDVK